MNYFKNKQTAGFTLIELLVVIAIIGVLSGVVLQSLKSARLKSYNATRLSDVDQINKALELYLTKTGGGANLPTTIAAANDATTWFCIGATTCWGGALVEAPGLTAALAPNISKIPKDPMLTNTGGDYYVYKNPYTTAQGTGAHIRWYANDFGTGASVCGRGTGPTIANGYRTCSLYLGK